MFFLFVGWPFVRGNGNDSSTTNVWVEGKLSVVTVGRRALSRRDAVKSESSVRLAEVYNLVHIRNPMRICTRRCACSSVPRRAQGAFKPWKTSIDRTSYEQPRSPAESAFCRFWRRRYAKL